MAIEQLRPRQLQLRLLEDNRPPVAIDEEELVSALAELLLAVAKGESSEGDVDDDA